MSDFQELIKKLDPLSGENLSSVNESDVENFTDILESLYSDTEELVKIKKKKLNLNKFLNVQENREYKKRENEDKRRKKNRLEDTVEFTEEKSEEETNDGLMSGLLSLLGSGALQAAVFAANPELATKIKLKKIQGKLIKFKPPKPKPPKPTDGPKPPTSLADEAVESAVRRSEIGTSAARRSAEAAAAARRNTRGGNVISRIFGEGLFGTKPKSTTVPIGSLPSSTDGVRRARVEVEIPGKGFRTVQDTGKVNNLIQEIRDKAIKNGFTPSEAGRYANSWKNKLLQAAKTSRNTFDILGRGIIKSLPFIGAGLGWVSANEREKQGFTRLAAFERAVAATDVAVGVSGATGVGAPAAAVGAVGTFMSDMGLMVIDLVDMATEIVTGKKIASNTVEYWLSKLDGRPVKPITNTKDPRFIRSQNYDAYINSVKKLNPTGSRFQQGGKVQRYQTGGSVDQIALKTIKQHEALSSLTPGQNDYVKVGGRSVISGTPWSKVTDNTNIYSYRDSKGIPTIGWGTVTQPSGKQTRDGEVISKKKADQLLSWNYQNMKNYMSRVIPTWKGMSPSQQAAIMALTYNTGPGWFATSGQGSWPNLTMSIASGDFRGALKHWTGSDAVLEPRRKEERELFSNGPAKPDSKKEKQGKTQKVNNGPFDQIKRVFGFQEGGEVSESHESSELSLFDNTNSTGPMSQQGMLSVVKDAPIDKVSRGGASSVNEMKLFQKIARQNKLSFQSGGIVLLTGHGDILDQNGTNGLIGSIGGETAEQYYTKKVAAAIRDKSGGKIKYIPSQVKWRALSDPEPPNSNWNIGKKQASLGNIPIELHFDAPTGRSGLITSNLNRPVSNAEKGLISGFGTISGDYGAGKYGVSMLELEPMKRSVAIGSLADKFIKSVEGKYGDVSKDTGSESVQQPSITQPTTGQRPTGARPTGGGILSGMTSLIPGLGSFLQGFTKGFKETSGIDIGTMFGSVAQESMSISSEQTSQTNETFIPMQLSGNKDEAFKKVYDIAKRLGDPVPELTAAQAMYESGWLSSPLARDANNPFGQSGRGNAGTIFYKNRNWAKYATLDDAIRSRIGRWANSTPKGGPGYASAGGAPIPGLRKILETYAPSSDGNNHTSYISSVSSILRQFGFDPNNKNTTGIRIASKQYGGFIDNSIQSRIVKQMVSGSVSNINNSEPQVVIVNSPQESPSFTPNFTSHVPSFSSFEYITGTGEDFIIVNKMYELLQLVSM